MKGVLYTYDAIRGLDLEQLFREYLERYKTIMKDLDGASDDETYDKANNAIKDLRQEICNYGLPVAVTWDMWLHKELNHNDVLVLERTDYIMETSLPAVLCCCLALHMDRILISTLYNPIGCLKVLQRLGCKCTETPLQRYHVNPQGTDDRCGMLWLLPELIYQKTDYEDKAN